MTRREAAAASQQELLTQLGVLLICRIGFALYAQFGPGKFPANWWSVAFCVVCYSALTMAINNYSQRVEGDAYLVCKPRKVGHLGMMNASDSAAVSEFKAFSPLAHYLETFTAPVVDSLDMSRAWHKNYNGPDLLAPFLSTSWHIIYCPAMYVCLQPGDSGLRLSSRMAKYDDKYTLVISSNAPKKSGSYRWDTGFLRASITVWLCVANLLLLPGCVCVCVCVCACMRACTGAFW